MRSRKSWSKIMRRISGGSFKIGKVGIGTGLGRSLTEVDVNTKTGLDGVGGSFETRDAELGLDGGRGALTLLESWGTQTGSVDSCIPDPVASGMAHAMLRPVNGGRGMAGA